MSEHCIFCKIIKGKIPSTQIYSDHQILAFLDIGPLKHGHCLVIPKKHRETIFEITNEEALAIFKASQKIGKAIMHTTKANGLNILQNNFAGAGQTVFHAHWHLIPRHNDNELFPWNPGKYSSIQEMELLATEIKKNF